MHLRTDDLNASTLHIDEYNISQKQIGDDDDRKAISLADDLMDSADKSVNISKDGSHSREPLALPAQCFGIGVNLNRARWAIRRVFIECEGKQPMLARAEETGSWWKSRKKEELRKKSGCSWWKNDHTKNCTSLFDCYLPPLTEVVDDSALRDLFKQERNNTVEE